MDALSIYGLFAVGSMLLFYALEARSARYVLLFAGACLASAVYGTPRAPGRSASSRAFGL